MERPIARFINTSFATLMCRRCLLAIALSVGMTTSYAQQATPINSENRYEDWFTFKNGKTYTADPYVWAYTREFAQLFRMPDKWIDQNLRGVLGVAFRMTTIGNMTCGLAGREDNCWPALECQLDVYYDNRINLPWTRDEIVRDLLMRGISSREFLHDSSGSKGIRRYASKVLAYPRVLTGGGVIKVGKYQSGSADVAYFDREFQPGIGLIGWVGVGVCPKPIGIGEMQFFDQETADKISRMKIRAEDARPTHTFEFSESFMRRANAVYELQNRPNREVTQRLIKQFLESRQLQGQP